MKCLGTHRVFGHGCQHTTTFHNTFTFARITDVELQVWLLSPVFHVFVLGELYEHLHHLVIVRGRRVFLARHPVVKVPVTVNCVYQDVELVYYLTRQRRSLLREKSAKDETILGNASFPA